MTIAILVPTRARPEQCKRMIQSARSTSTEPLFISLGVGSDWEIYKEMIKEFQDVRKLVMHRFPDKMPTAQKWNLLAEFALQEFEHSPVEIPTHYMLGSDDMVFTTPEWDRALIEHYNALENKIHVYAFQDSRDKEGTPHPIVTREYIEAMGYFVPPIFLHWFVDSWTVQIAKANKCFTHLKDYLLVHDKPSDKGNPDETHSRIREWGWHDRDKYVNDKMQLLLSDEKQRLTDIMMGAV